MSALTVASAVRADTVVVRTAVVDVHAYVRGLVAPKIIEAPTMIEATLAYGSHFSEFL